MPQDTRQPEPITIRIESSQLHHGRITPLLYGSFIELLDDHVPGMWAEMLNDRGFEGVTPRAGWCYHVGEPNICDRDWVFGPGASIQSEGAWNGERCALLAPAQSGASTIVQHDLYVHKGMKYAFSGHFRSDTPGCRVRVTLKALLPDESWMVLATEQLEDLSRQWQRLTCDLVSAGTTDRAVFELTAEGSGEVTCDRLSLMPEDNLLGWRRDVVEAIRNLKTPLIRWGGCAVDPGHYRWKECVGPRDDRKPFANTFWGRIDSNDVGIDEFLQFCELVSAEALVCVSFADGAQNAGDLVHYCNDPITSQWGAMRAKNGHPEPYHVEYWQIGNELEGEDYAAGFTEIATAIRTADPNAIVMASYPSPELLARAAKVCDYVCPHFYRDDFEQIEKEIRDAYASALQAGAKADVAVGVTEWNFTNPWGRERTRLATVESGLMTARFLDLFHRNSDIVRLTCRSNMCNSLMDGIIHTRPSGVLLTPAYHVMKLYTEHSKPVPLSMRELPESMEGSVCSSEDRSEVCVFLTNWRTEPSTVLIDLSAFGGRFLVHSAEVVRDTQDMSQMDAMNHWTAPTRIRTTPLAATGNTVTLPPLSVAAVECRRP